MVRRAESSSWYGGRFGGLLCARLASGAALHLLAASALAQYVLTQPAPIVINDNAAASPYPSVLDLSSNGLGLIERMSVTISNLTESYASDVGLLLVGPNGNSVVLMSGAGGNPAGSASVTNLTLTFSDDASASAPVDLPLISGSSYKPTDNAHLSFPVPAPASNNYSSSLNGAFGFSSPSGRWSLYVLDTVPGPFSPYTNSIDSWAFSLFVAPTISGLQNDVIIPQGAILIMNFTVADVDGIVTNVTGTILGNPGLATITTSLNETNVAMTVQANAFSFTNNVLEVIATDSQGFTATNHVIVTMSGEDSILCPSLSQTVRAGDVLGPIPFTIGHRSGLPFQGTVQVSSDNQKLLPDANILVQQTGTGNYTLTALAVGAQPGGVNITISASDGGFNTTCTFNVLVQEPGNPLFVSASPITINAGDAATPYPSTNKVNGLIGSIERVAVTLLNITHPAPGNCSMLLVGPLGTNVLLMAGAGGGNSLLGTTLVFDDSATNRLPLASLITSGSYEPTAFGMLTDLLPPAPGQPYGSDLVAFNGTDPNGDWMLYVMDMSSAKSGAITGGWQLSVQTAPAIPAIKDHFTDENVSTKVIITIGDNQPGVNTTVTASGDPTLFQPITVSGSGATRTLSISPQPYKWGTNIITVVATDPLGMTATQAFSMGVKAVSQPPIFVMAPGDQFVPPGTALGPLPFQIWSPQGSALNVTASFDNLTLVSAIKIESVGSNNGTNNYDLFLIPAGSSIGSAIVTIVATDITGLYNNTTFKLYVQGDIFSLSMQPILIPPGPTNGDLQQGEASPFPSTISVRGLGGVISKLHATIVGLNHQYPSDLDVLLVGPDNTTAVMLMSHAGAGGSANGSRLEFQQGWSPIPSSATLTSEVYAPADYSSGLTLPAPAPGRPYSTNLSVFNGLSPNGDWKLYVMDDTYPDGGSIDNGWLLYFDVMFPPVLYITQNGTVLRVRFTGAPNRSYGIQSTVDLSTWSDARAVLTDSTGSAEFDVNIDPSSVGRFYRVVGQ